MTDPILYFHPFSSYSQKALVAFYETGTPFEGRLLSPENPAAGEELKALWQLERFPVLQDGDRTWMESSVIIEWVDARAGGGRLIPAEPEAALEVRMLDRIFDGYVMTPMQQVVFDRIRPEGARDAYGVEQARTMLAKAYDWLEDRMTGREWAAGVGFSMADCAAAGSLFYADWVQPVEGRPALTDYLCRLWRRPSVKRAVDEARPYRDFFPLGAPQDAAWAKG